MKTLLAIALLCVPAFAQQVNVDIVPASPGLNIGHPNQRWNANLDHVDANSVTVNGAPVGASGGSGATCPAGSVALQYFNGTLIVCDSNANFDGNVTWTFENINSLGTITAGSLATTGPGGVLHLKFQQPPTTVPAGEAQVYANFNTNQIDCLRTGLVECFNSVQLIASGTAAMSTSAVSAGGCNVTTVSAPGVTTSSRVFANTTVDSTGVTGYGPSTAGGLWIPSGWATTNNVNFKVCNDTANPITGGALSLTWVAF